MTRSGELWTPCGSYTQSHAAQTLGGEQNDYFLLNEQKYTSTVILP